MIAMLDVAPLAGFKIRLQLAVAPIQRLQNVNKSSETLAAVPLSLSVLLFLHIRAT